MNFVCNLMEQKEKVMKIFQDPYSKAKGDTVNPATWQKKTEKENSSC